MGVDELGVDEMGVDEMGVDEMRSRRSLMTTSPYCPNRSVNFQHVTIHNNLH